MPYLDIYYSKWKWLLAEGAHETQQGFAPLLQSRILPKCMILNKGSPCTFEQSFREIRTFQRRPRWFEVPDVIKLQSFSEIIRLYRSAYHPSSFVTLNCFSPSSFMIAVQSIKEGILSYRTIPIVAGRYQALPISWSYASEAFSWKSFEAVFKTLLRDLHQAVWKRASGLV